MEVRMESKQGAAVIGIDPVLTEIHKRLQSHPRQWLQALRQDPVPSSTWKKLSMTPFSK